MVKLENIKKFESDVSTSLSLSDTSSSELQMPETLSNIINKLPKLTYQERKHAYKLNNYQTITSRKWSQKQTLNFYALLRNYGVDFTLMSYNSLFKGSRNQKELSNKYKKEIKRNPVVINKILDEIYSKNLYGLNVGESSISNQLKVNSQK